jgi:hypothetical protein
LFAVGEVDQKLRDTFRAGLVHGVWLTSGSITSGEFVFPLLWEGLGQGLRGNHPFGFGGSINVEINKSSKVHLAYSGMMTSWQGQFLV